MAPHELHPDLEQTHRPPPDAPPDHTTPLLPPHNRPHTTPKPSPIPALRHVLFASFLFTMSISMTFSVRPQIVLDAAGGDASRAGYYTGVVDSLQAVISIILVPLLGAISDLVGRRPIFILSHLGELTALLIIAQFPSSLAVQFPAYLLFTFTGAFFVTASTMIADLATESTQQATAFFGWNGATHGIGFLIGPLVGGLVETHFYKASSFHAAAFVIFLTIVYECVFLPETLAVLPIDALREEEEGRQGVDEEHGQVDGQSAATTAAASAASSSPRRPRASSSPPSPERQMHGMVQRAKSTGSRIVRTVAQTDVNPLPRVREFFGRTPAMRWLAAAIAAASLAQSGLMSYFFLYTAKKLSWGTDMNGFFMSTLGVALIISQGVLAPITMRLLGERWTIIYSIFLHGVHFVLYGVARDAGGMYVSMVVGAFSFVYDPALKAVLCKQTTPERQGALQGSLAALKDMVRPFAPILQTGLFGLGIHIGFMELPLHVAAGIFTLAAVFATVAFCKPGLKF